MRASADPSETRRRGPARRIVVTADDFGLSPMVNEGIVTAYRQGIVRNTALLVNFPGLETAVASLRDAEGLDVGIHLNLTGGPPVSEADRVPSLVGRGGRFPGLLSFLGGAALGRVDWGQVRREWAAQIERGLRLGCRFSSISSHHHVHMLPPLMRIAATLARNYDIPLVRLSRYLGGTGTGPSRRAAWCLRPCVPLARRILRGQGVPHNDYLVGIPPLMANRAVDRFARALRRLPAGLCEMTCHPGYVDAALRRRDRYSAGRLAELEVLTAPQLRAALEAAGVEATTYRTVIAAGRIGWRPSGDGEAADGRRD